MYRIDFDDVSKRLHFESMYFALVRPLAFSWVQDSPFPVLSFRDSLDVSNSYVYLWFLILLKVSLLRFTRKYLTIQPAGSYINPQWTWRDRRANVSRSWKLFAFLFYRHSTVTPWRLTLTATSINPVGTKKRGRIFWRITLRHSFGN